MKVHITFDKDLLADSEARETVKNEIMRQADLHDVNDKRFERYGILTGTIDNPSVISEIQEIQGVAKVSVDSEKHAVA